MLNLFSLFSIKLSYTGHMTTISISKLKAGLSGEIKKVRAGKHIIVLDHNHPVAELIPFIEVRSLFVKEAETHYKYKKLSPIIENDIMHDLEDERSDR